MAAYGTTASAGVAKILSGLLSEHNKCRGTFDQPTPGRTPDDGRSLSLSLSLPRLASFPPVQICISTARTPRLERSRKRYRSSDPAVATLSRDVFIRAERTRSSPSLPPVWALYRWTRAAVVESTDERTDGNRGILKPNLGAKNWKDLRESERKSLPWRNNSTLSSVCTRILESHGGFAIARFN